MTADPLARLMGLEGVPSAFAAARDGIDAVLRDRGLRRTSPEDTAESLLRGAHASAVLEGSGSSLEEVRSGAGDPIAQAAVRVSTDLLSLTPVLGRSPGQVFARLHALAGAGEVPNANLGRPRDAAAADRLRGVVEVITAQSTGQSAGQSTGRSTVPALVVAAVVHADLAVAGAFASHNGIVARAAERLVLVSRGVDEKSLVVPEAGHLALRAAYESNLAGYRDGGPAGVHAWLLYAAEAYGAGAEASPVVR